MFQVWISEDRCVLVEVDRPRESGKIEAMTIATRESPGFLWGPPKKLTLDHTRAS